MYSHTLSLSNLVVWCYGDVEPSGCVSVELNLRNVVGCVCRMVAVRFYYNLKQEIG